MFVKLALRNVKRQFSNYIVYFTTVMITIALIFSVVNMVYSSDLIKPVTAESSIEDDMKSKGILVAMIIISAIISLIISRSQVFILGIRKRELGTYKLLGMKNKNIIKIFTAETGIIYLMTTVCGMILGMFFYQGLNSVIAKFIGAEFKLTGYSYKTIFTTLGLALIVFIVSAFSSAEFLKKTDINQLISNRKKKESKLNKSSYKLATALCVISILLWIFLFELIRETIGVVEGKNTFILNFLENVFAIEGSDAEGVISVLVAGLLFLIVPATILIFNMAYPRCFVNLLQKNKRLSSRGANTFILRQLSSKATANSSMYGAIAILLSFIVVLICFGVNYREIIKKGYDHGYDLIVTKDVEEITDEIVSEYTGIKDKVSVSNFNFGSLIGKDSKYPGISVSDAFALLKAEGNDNLPDDRNCCYVSVSSNKQLNEGMGIADPKFLLNKKYEYKNRTFSPEKIVNSEILNPGTVIIPDDIAELFKSEEHYTSVTSVYYFFDGRKYDVYAMEKELNSKSAYMDFRDYFVKTALSDAAPVFMLLLFGIVSFMILSMAIIGLKASSEVSEDRVRYQKLYQMGVNKKILSGILMKQTALFFVFPMVQPVVFSFFMSYIFSNMLSYMTYTDIRTSDQTALTLIFMGVIYFTYFIITYNFLKKKIIMEKEQRKIL